MIPSPSVPRSAPERPGSAPLQRFELIERARPVRAEQSRQSAIGEELAPGLATRAVIRLVVGVADALHRIVTARAGFAIAAVHRHLLAKGGDFLGEAAGGLADQPVGPLPQRIQRGRVQPRPLLLIE